MKRTITSIAAASMALGMLVPVAFASSSTSSLKKASQLPIVVNGAVLSNPYEMTGMDSGNTTGFFPIYYFNQALAKVGFTATWDGVNHVWAITAPAGTTVAPVAGGVGTGNTSVTVNGTVVKKFNTQAAKDPAGSQVTTYLPIFYINNVLSALGVKGTFSGQTGLSVATQQVVNNAANKLSTIKVENATSGSGSSSDPAVSLGNKSITISTTLTDADGNAVSDTAVEFEFSEYGNFLTAKPTVSDVNGTVISGTDSSDYTQYKAYTDANGVATLTVAGPAGQTYAYQIVAAAPYKAGSGLSVSSAPAFAEFVQSNQAVITPYAGSNNPFKATMGTAVPVTVALPLGANGKPLANELVTLTASAVDGPVGQAYFTNASGANLGSTIQVATDANGMAHASLTTTNSEDVDVSATLPTGIGLNDPADSFIEFGQSGVPSKVSNYSISSNSVQAGQKVTVSGTLVDAAGNAVANGQILVVGNDLANTKLGTLGSNDNGSFAYVGSDGKTLTDFPDVGVVTNGQISVAQGLAATSNTGDVVTADSNGNFSFQVTDTNDDEDGTFTIYGVSNGTVTNGLLADTISFSTGTDLASIALGGTDTQATAHTVTSLTGLSATNHAHGVVFVDPQNAAGDPITGQSFNYNLSVDNGGTVSGIAGVDANGNVTGVLPINSDNPGLSSVIVSVKYVSAGNYQITVPGQNGTVTSASADFAAYVYNSGNGDTKLTVNNGSVSSTADFNFTGGAATYAQSFSPVSATMQAGKTQDVTFTVEDSHGNPVANAQTNFLVDQGTDPLWIQAVNGVALQQSENMGTAVSASYSTEPTPIPFGAAPAAPAAPGYTSVNLAGVVNWSSANANVFSAYSDASGKITLTLENGANYYVAPAAGSGSVASVAGATSNQEYFYTWDKKGDSASKSFAFAVEPSAAAAAVVNPLLTQQLGVIYFGAGTTNLVGTPGTITTTAPGGTDAVAGGTVTLALPNGAVTGGTYSVSGPTGYNTTKATLGTDGAGNEVLVFATGSKAGTYTVTYSLNGTTEDTGTYTLAAGPIASANVSNAYGAAISAEASNAQTLSGVVASGAPVTLILSATDAAGNAVSGTATVTFTDAGRATPSTLAGSALVAGTLTFTNGTAALTYTPGTALVTPAADTIVITVGSNTDTVSTNLF